MCITGYSELTATVKVLNRTIRELKQAVKRTEASVNQSAHDLLHSSAFPLS